MPSFFFHIAFDLDTASSSSVPPSSHQRNTTIQQPNEYRTKPETKTVEDTFIPTSSSGTSGGSPQAKTTALPVLFHDWRYGNISMQNINMAPATLGKGGEDSTANLTNGISAGPGGLATKGRYEPLDPQQEKLGWGVVRLYRDSEETPGLYDEPESQKSFKYGRHTLKKSQDTDVPFRDEDCTTLCILAVPSYLTPSDFLGFVGEKTRDEVSHFRMIRTERGNRYMVLMKFRNGKKAREWRREWNGKPFDGMEVNPPQPFLRGN